MDMIEASDSPWSSPVFLVTKKDGSSLCRAEIRNESPEVSTGRERSSSNLAIQSSPDCTGTKSASSELPVETESNGWSES